MNRPHRPHQRHQHRHGPRLHWFIELVIIPAVIIALLLTLMACNIPPHL